ncbi:cadherin-related family member 5 isoform X5 [Ambystoma mexicanum]|uniref:cadherin-related family member 5 isoform X5 n=1 Tax=Ambystoma mexicanum TaxID=8296 RepID=UPI0037E8E1EC
MAASPAFPRVPLLLLLMMSYLRTALAQNPDCSANRNNQIYENNRPGISVTPIFADTGVTVTINQDQGSEFFEIINNELILKTSLDYETTQAIVLRLSCERNGVPVQTLTVIVEVLGVNDETPVFNLDFVAWDLPEDAKVGTSLAALTATDLDYDLIYYDLGFSSQNVSSHFTLTGSNSPVIQVSKALDYDSFTHVQLTLYARDTSDPNANISHTASATINVTILDVDNKNPWFKPCRFIDSSKKICHSDGYKVNVTRSVQATGALALDPGPLYAVDGDQGINEAVTYHIISGNDQDIFDLNSMTGNITMKKAADVLGTTVLEVMASQANNTLRYAITTVRIQVVEKNNHAPTFPSTNYQGTVPAFSLPGSLVMEYLSPSRPLKIFAADADFPGGRNPDVTYSLQNSSDFSVTQDGFIQSAAQLNHSITIVVSAAAIDRTSGEEATTLVLVEVTPAAGIPVVGSQLGYSAADMAAVGATLGVVLLICLAFLGFLIHKQYGHKFKRNSETDGTFSSEGSGDTNDSNNRLIDNEEVEPTISGSTAVENEDGVLNLNFNVSETTTDSSVGRGAAVRLTAEPNLGAAIPAAFIAAEQLQEDLDNDKEVKSILTKERRVNDESYKAVWFKGDIEPDEVVMINEHEQAGEGQEDDSEEEDEDDDEGEDGEENQGSDYIQTPTVAFSTLNEPGDTTESTNTML